MKNYFVINDLSDGKWSVTWSRFEYNVVNNPGKVLVLLEILFEHVGVEEAMIGVQQPGRDNNWKTLHVSSILWWLDDTSREHMAKRIAEYVVSGVQFYDRFEAEKFKSHMEQRLAWAWLGGKW